MDTPHAPATHLLLDCAFAGVTLALARAMDTGLHLCASRTTAAARNSDALAPLLNDLFDNTGTTAQHLTHVGVTVGPGSFTGCRLGLAVAEALQIVNPSVQIFGLSTLAALARHVVTEAPVDGPFRVVLDAAGAQAYTQLFSPDGAPLEPALCGPVTDIMAQTRLQQVPIAAQGSLMLNLPPALLLPSLDGLPPQILVDCAARPDMHLPPHPVYLKPLTYHKVAEALVYTTPTPVVAAFEALWENPLMTHAEVLTHLSSPHHALIWHSSGAHALVSLPPHGTADVLTLFTPETARRKGYARIVLDALTPLARAAACEAITLEVRASNTPAQGLYLHYGFTAISTRPAYYQNPTEDATVLTYTL